jgi:hypothetical protein
LYVREIVREKERENINGGTDQTVPDGAKRRVAMLEEVGSMDGWMDGWI